MEGRSSSARSRTTFSVFSAIDAMDDNAAPDLARVRSRFRITGFHHDGGERLPHFVVQLAGERAPFLLLRAHEPRRKRLQIRAGLRGFTKPPFYFAFEPARQGDGAKGEQRPAEQRDSKGDNERPSQTFRRRREPYLRAIQARAG